MFSQTFNLSNSWKYDDKVKLSIKALSNNGVYDDAGNFTFNIYGAAASSRYVNISTTQSKFGDVVQIWQGTSRNTTNDDNRGYIRIPATGSNRYNINPGSEPFSFETWVKPVRNAADLETSAGGPIFQLHNNNSNFFSLAFNRRGTGTYVLSLHYLTGGAWTWIASHNTGVTTGYDSQWVHIAMTRTGGTWRFYINGATATMTTDAGSAPSAALPTYNDLLIGTSKYSYIVDFNGCLDNYKYTIGRVDYTTSFTQSYTNDYTKI